MGAGAAQWANSVLCSGRLRGVCVSVITHQRTCVGGEGHLY